MPDKRQDEQSGVGRPFWSGTITFGLVSVPVNLYPASRGSKVSLRMLGPGGVPLKRRYVSGESEEEGEETNPEQFLRGYEVEPGKFIEVTEQELERLAPEKSRDIDLQRFVPADSIPPMYFERAYFLTPAGPSTKAYRLLADTMRQTRRAGVATFVMRGKEYLIAILSENGVLRAETLRFQDELRTPENIGLPAIRKAPKAAVARFQKVIDAEASDELPEDELHNEQAARLRKLIESKRKRKQDVARDALPEVGRENVVDILSVLKRRLEQNGPRKGSSKPAKSEFDSLSKKELYERAKDRNIEGRSGMTRQQLIEALRQPA